jgi:hypothetical protein
MQTSSTHDLYQCVICETRYCIFHLYTPLMSCDKTIDLAPGDYHRFHSPTNWTLRTLRHIKGKKNHLQIQPLLSEKKKNRRTPKRLALPREQAAQPLCTQRARGAERQVGAWRLPYDTRRRNERGEYRHQQVSCTLHSFPPVFFFLFFFLVISSVSYCDLCLLFYGCSLSTPTNPTGALATRRPRRWTSCTRRTTTRESSARALRWAGSGWGARLCLCLRCLGAKRLRLRRM